jgi:hypothetical protein
MKWKLYALLGTLALSATIIMTTVGSGTADASGPTFTIPGVISTGALASYFTCTSTATAPQKLTVQVLDDTGTTVASVSGVNLNPRATLPFETGAAASVAGVSVGGGVSFTGFATISSSSSLVCSAMVLDRLNKSAQLDGQLAGDQGNEAEGRLADARIPGPERASCGVAKSPAPRAQGGTRRG